MIVNTSREHQPGIAESSGLALRLDAAMLCENSELLSCHDFWKRSVRAALRTATIRSSLAM
jgi:hypothetical protein